MQYFTITKYGDSNFNLKYDDSQLLDIITGYIQKKIAAGEDYFTYFTLCKTVLKKADSENMLLDKEADTFYASPNLSPKEYTRISRLLWKLILEGKIFVDFSNNAYIAHYENDTVLGIIK